MWVRVPPPLPTPRGIVGVCLAFLGVGVVVYGGLGGGAMILLGVYLAQRQ